MQKRPEALQLRPAVTELSSRAELALSQWGAQLRAQTKAPAVKTPNAAADRLVAEDKLRQQLAEIENETITVKREYDAKAATMMVWEEKAARAMQHSDDVTATEALAVRAQHAEALQGLVNELTTLQTLATSCREALAAPR